MVTPGLALRPLESWGGINGSGAGASIDLENDVVDYAEFGVLVNGDNDQSASVTLEANSFSDELSEAVDIDVGSTPPVLEKNVAVDARTPGDNIVGYYFVEGSALNFNDLTELGLWTRCAADGGRGNRGHQLDHHQPTRPVVRRRGQSRCPSGHHPLD